MIINYNPPHVVYCTQTTLPYIVKWKLLNLKLKYKSKQFRFGSTISSYSLILQPPKVNLN